jgi:glycerol-3-phosphate acyltransferase PlsY
MDNVPVSLLATGLAVVLAYLLGSVSFAIIVSKFFKLSDPRTYGSKNPGATNVLRSGNKAAAAITLLLDALKGWLAIWLVENIGPRYGVDDNAVAWVAVAVFLGHLYPIFFKFKGGKGVATALGVFVGLAWWLGLATAVTWLVIAIFFRYSSLAAIVAAVFAPFYYVLLVGTDEIALAIVVISAFVLYRHRQNIANLLAGKESRIGSKKKA